jgi:hypothetical protein
MNLIKFWKAVFSFSLKLSFGGGGGGGPASTTSTGTTYQTNIPEYAQPYVETMLGATQKQLFTMDGNEITGFKPYQPYSTNVADYVAPMSPLQQEAMQATGQLQVPGQFAPATDLTMGAGLGSLGAAQQAMGAGQQYAQMATSPEAQQAYMSPYMQNVVDYQKSQALRDYGIGQGMRKAQSVGQGAFGGNRAALMEAEAQRNLTSQLQGIEAQGRQAAFQQAQQAQQFGSQLGMQGLQTGLQGYGQMGQAGAGLGSLGAQQLAAQKDVLGTKYQMGAQQQAIEQQKINQAIQDWANTQQYPLMQLGVMSNMLRGLPMQSATTNQYVAAPNALTQGIGTVGAIGSLANVFKGGKEGGLPSEFKPTTGIKSYDVGGSVKGKLYDMSPDELQDYIKESSSPIAKRLAEEVLRDKVGKASGGIIAFKDRGEVEDPEMVRQAYIDAARMKAEQDNTEINAENKRLLGRSPAIVPPTSIPNINQVVANREAGLPKDFPSELSYEADKARSEFQQKVMEQGGQPKPRQMGTSTTPMTDAERIAGFKAALNQTRAAAPAPSENTIPGTSTVTNVPQGTRAAPAPAPSTTAAAPTPAPAGITSALRTGNPELDKYIASTLAEANKPEKTISEIAAERRAYIGPDEFTPKERARLMAEKANAKEEATRQNWMRMAEFFATWGSTPGNSIAAGLVALKNKVPDFIADSKEQKKILRDIDASITGLDKAERLERAGEFDKAAELKQKLSADLKGKVGNVLTFAASNLSSQRSLEAAKVRAETTGGAGGENKLLAKIEADIGREKKDPAYQRAFKWGNMPVTKDTSPEMKSRIEAEKANLQKFEDDFERRREQARKGGSTTTTATPAPGGKPTSTAPGGKLVQNKDGSFTYAPQ